MEHLIISFLRNVALHALDQVISASERGEALRPHDYRVHRAAVRFLDAV
jgi:hypothetical protein